MTYLVMPAQPKFCFKYRRLNTILVAQYCFVRFLKVFIGCTIQIGHFSPCQVNSVLTFVRLLLSSLKKECVIVVFKVIFNI